MSACAARSGGAWSRGGDVDTAAAREIFGRGARSLVAETETLVARLEAVGG